ncbi:TetR/AcrR family transcriptional regulator [uncultured Jatrophihabitans sp.]|uniref:TetR/AcrR family transcriptional regulator n=1 Tax=uncultured Jatrophihabitans sp. TaxID=1610747 RepID=UPI0035CC9032
MPPETRRRGQVLEDALLEAAWSVLERVGYPAVTFEAVAAEAATSRTVLYRRWPTVPDLVLAAVVHHAPASATVAPDTGTLRGDLRAVLTHMSDRLSDLLAAAPGLLSEFPGNPALLETVRAEVFGSPTAIVQELIDRAAARGELPTAELAAATLTAPLDAARYQLVMTKQPLDDVDLDEIVDQVALPLYGAGRRAGS